MLQCYINKSNSYTLYTTLPIPTSIKCVLLSKQVNLDLVNLFNELVTVVKQEPMWIHLLKAAIKEIRGLGFRSGKL